MKIVKFLLVAFVGVGLMAGQAFAFTCPVLIKGANESITKVESVASTITVEREKDRALVMIQLAKDLVKQADADHKEAGAKKDARLHYNAEAKAKAAKALVDMVK